MIWKTSGLALVPFDKVISRHLIIFWNLAKAKKICLLDLDSSLEGESVGRMREMAARVQ